MLVAKIAAPIMTANIETQKMFSYHCSLHNVCQHFISMMFFFYITALMMFANISFAMILADITANIVVPIICLLILQLT